MMTLPVLTAISLALAVGVQPLIGPALPATLLLLLLYVPMSILLSYAGSYLFKDPDACQRHWPPIINLAAFMPYIAVGVIDATGDFDTALKMHYMLCVLDPPYTLLGGLYFIFRVTLVASMDLLGTGITTAMYFKWNNHVLPTMLIILGELFGFALLLYLIESRRNKASVFSKCRGDSSGSSNSSSSQYDARLDSALPIPKPESKDVLAARTAVEAPTCNSAIKVQNLHKTFPVVRRTANGKKIREQKFAVQRLAFGVDLGEVFGLLGHKYVRGVHDGCFHLDRLMVHLNATPVPFSRARTSRARLHVSN